LVVVSVAALMIILHLQRTPTFYLSKRFYRFEKYRPKITLYGLYIIPIGALLINGSLITFFVSYIYLTRSYQEFISMTALLLPHGINESLALLIAAALGLAYLKILSPLILNRKWQTATRKAKLMLHSKVTWIFLVIIALLVVFSGFIEAMLTLLFS
jgi:uncharacterized membrane protein SpoIIM required for sporulation